MEKIENLKNFNSETQRIMRYKQMKMEQDTFAKLRIEGWKIFSPTVVCDSIGIREGKVVFNEFKKPNQDLTKNQEKVRDLANNY